MYTGKGKVTKINLQAPSVELDHEEIQGLMPAMVMEFYVTEKSLLDGIKVGDKVDFQIEYKGGTEKIMSIQKTK
jgi:Cu/Ag efflux protein CusF